MLPNIRNYEQLYREFRWPQLARYNIGVDVCDRWAAQDASRLAILNVRADGRTEEITFGWLRETSNRLANTLAAHGVTRGDRVAMLLPQTPEAAAGHIAIYKLGAIAVPLAILFGVDALTYRLQNAGVKAVITNAQGLAKLTEARASLPELSLVQPLQKPAPSRKNGSFPFPRCVGSSRNASSSPRPKYLTSISKSRLMRIPCLLCGRS